MNTHREIAGCWSSIAFTQEMTCRYWDSDRDNDNDSGIEARWTVREVRGIEQDGMEKSSNGSERRLMTTAGGFVGLGDTYGHTDDNCDDDHC